ncbi:hypothetical protein ACHWQZ_G013741 [Mnemiopsis leidyi]
MGEEKIHNNNHGYTSVDVKKPETKRSQMTFRERWCSCSRGVERNHYILLFLCIVIVIAVTLSITIIYLSGKNEHEKKPHVVLVIADDMGYNDIGYYNKFGDISTPHLDKLASEGVRLDKYYGQSICTPARAALFTGRYPYRYGMQGARPIVYGAKFGLPLSEEQLLPQVMKEGGYSTYLVGKWHLGYSKWDYTPIKRGFDYFYGMYGGFADYYTHISAEPESPDNAAFDLHEHFADNITSTGEVRETDDQNVELIRDTWQDYSEKLFTDKAVQIIRDHDIEKSSLFLTVSYMNPHSPLQALKDDLRRVPDNVTNSIRKKFSALMVSLDTGVQQLTEALKSRNMYDNTIFIFTGDNGGAVQGPINSNSLGGTNWPLRGSKWTIWEGGVKVPAFVRGPGITPNAKSQDLFHITDWLPTLAGLVGVTPKMKLDGVDQSGLLKGTTNTSARQDLVLELDPAYQQAAYIKDNYKIILGDPSPKPYDDIYPPLTKEGDTWYKSFENTTINPYGRDMYAEFSKLCDEKIETYQQKLDDTSFNFKNIQSIAEFDHTNIRLYDLENDPSEKHDLFTSQERYKTLARDMYDYLGEQSKQMSDLIFFVGEDNRDVTNAYKRYTLDPPLPGDIDHINKWRPWL